jgi:hypothetical protein
MRTTMLAAVLLVTGGCAIESLPCEGGGIRGDAGVCECPEGFEVKGRKCVEGDGAPDASAEDASTVADSGPDAAGDGLDGGAGADAASVATSDASNETDGASSDAGGESGTVDSSHAEPDSGSDAEASDGGQPDAGPQPLECAGRVADVPSLHVLSAAEGLPVPKGGVIADGQYAVSRIYVASYVTQGIGAGVIDIQAGGTRRSMAVYRPNVSAGTVQMLTRYEDHGLVTLVGSTMLIDKTPCSGVGAGVYARESVEYSTTPSGFVLVHESDGYAVEYYRVQ